MEIKLNSAVWYIIALKSINNPVKKLSFITYTVHLCPRYGPLQWYQYNFVTKLKQPHTSLHQTRPRMHMWPDVRCIPRKMTTNMVVKI